MAGRPAGTVMASDTSSGTAHRPSGGLPGFGLGVVAAAAFVLVIRLLPTAWLQPASPALAGVLVGALALAPPFTLLAWWLADRIRADRQHVLATGIAGAGAFDGLAISFAPGIYGHEGAALASAAAMLLFGLAAIWVTGALLGRHAGEPGPTSDRPPVGLRVAPHGPWSHVHHAVREDRRPGR